MMLVDSNEPGDIIAELGLAGIPVEVVQLRPAADYIVGGKALTKGEVLREFRIFLYRTLSYLLFRKSECHHIKQRSAKDAEDTSNPIQEHKNIVSHVQNTESPMLVSKSVVGKNFSERDWSGEKNGQKTIQKESKSFIDSIIIEDLKKLKLIQRFMQNIEGSEINNSMNIKIGELLHSLNLEEVDVKCVDSLMLGLSKFIIWTKLANRWGDINVEELLGKISLPRGVGTDFNSYVQTVIELYTILEQDHNFPYTYGGFAIERKSNIDFYQSIYSRRLFEQLYNLNKMEEYKPILAVHGPIPCTHKWMRVRGRPVKLSLSKDEKAQKERTAMSTFATSVNSYDRVSLITFKSQEQFIKFIVDLYYRQTQKARKPVKKRKAETIKDVKWNIMSQLPGIGSKGATTLANSELSIVELGQLSPKELQDMFEGVGPKRAELIHEVLNA